MVPMPKWPPPSRTSQIASASAGRNRIVTSRKKPSVAPIFTVLRRRPYGGERKREGQGHPRQAAAFDGQTITPVAAMPTATVCNRVSRSRRKTAAITTLISGLM